MADAESSPGIPRGVGRDSVEGFHLVCDGRAVARRAELCAALQDGEPGAMTMRRLRSNGAALILLPCCLVFLSAEGVVRAQAIPNVTCKVENYERSPGIDMN